MRKNISSVKNTNYPCGSPSNEDEVGKWERENGRSLIEDAGCKQAFENFCLLSIGNGGNLTFHLYPMGQLLGNGSLSEMKYKIQEIGWHAGDKNSTLDQNSIPLFFGKGYQEEYEKRVVEILDAKKWFLETCLLFRESPCFDDYFGALFIAESEFAIVSTIDAAIDGAEKQLKILQRLVDAEKRLQEKKELQQELLEQPEEGCWEEKLASRDPIILIYRGQEEALRKKEEVEKERKQLIANSKLIAEDQESVRALQEQLFELEKKEKGINNAIAMGNRMRKDMEYLQKQERHTAVLRTIASKQKSFDANIDRYFDSFLEFLEKNDVPRQFQNIFLKIAEMSPYAKRSWAYLVFLLQCVKFPKETIKETINKLRSESPHYLYFVDGFGLVDFMIKKYDTTGEK